MRWDNLPWQEAGWSLVQSALVHSGPGGLGCGDGFLQGVAVGVALGGAWVCGFSTGASLGFTAGWLARSYGFGIGRVVRDVSRAACCARRSR